MTAPRRPSPADAFELDWLNERRVRAYPRVIVALYALLIVVWLSPSQGLLDRMGKPIGTDFVALYAAGTLVAEGRAGAVYDRPALRAAERRMVGGDIDLVPLAYSPSLLLGLPALSAVPYLVALPLWLVVTFLPFAAVVRRAAPHPVTLWLTLALPAAYLNVVHGQAGFLVAALFGGALLLLERRPLLAGVLFGALTVAPPFAVLVPVALVAERRWRALGAMVVATVAIALGCVAAFGTDIFDAFITGLSSMGTPIDADPLILTRMHTVFAGARLLHIGVAGAWTLQAVVALVVAVALWRGWRRGADPALKYALLTVGAVLASPYGLEYDLTLLALPVAWLGWHGVQHGFRAGEKVALLMAWLMPFATPGIAAGLGVPLGPVVLGGFFWIIWRRIAAEPAPRSPR